MAESILPPLLDEYFRIQKRIHEYFGYRENYRVIPLDDQKKAHWMISGGEGKDGICFYSPYPFTQETIEDGEHIYSAKIYTQRFLPKWVYRGPDFTLVCTDTETDGNKFLMIFDNTLECTDVNLRDQCRNEWG